MVRENFPDSEIRITLHKANNVLGSITLFVSFNSETMKPCSLSTISQVVPSCSSNIHAE